MKSFFKTIALLCAAVISVFAVRYFVTGELPTIKKDSDISLTTVTKVPATEKYDQRQLLATLDDEDYQLYRSDTQIILVHGGKEYEFNLWSSSIGEEAPSMYLFDLDGDGKKEIIIRGVAGEDRTKGGWIYNLYILSPKADEDGYTVSIASQDTWQAFLDENIKEEMSQLKQCKKYIQFSMCTKSETITYDETTGIALDGHTGYARALQGKDGSYLTINTWSKGKGEYTVSSDGKLCVSVDINISYKEDSSLLQAAGTILFEISMNTEKNFYVTPKSMQFKAADAYKLAPLQSNAAAWNLTENNSAAVSGSGEIKYINYSPVFDESAITQTTNLSSQTSDVKNVKSIVVSDSKVVITAMDGYTFSQDVAKSSNYSVNINKGTNDAYDISYTASLDKTKTTLVITFDNSYPRDYIKSIEINFGTK